MAKECPGFSDCPEMEYFMNESQSDFVFIIEGQRLPALKQYLSVKSKVFKAMFSANFKESKDKELVIRDTTFEAFKTFIRFLYCDQLVLNDDKDCNLIEEICKLADFYQTPRLMAKLAERLKTLTVSKDNLGSISRIGAKYGFKEVMERVGKYIGINLNTITKQSKSQLIAMNDSTHNQLLQELIESYLGTKSQLIHFRSRVCVEFSSDNQKKIIDLLNSFRISRKRLH